MATMKIRLLMEVRPLKRRDGSTYQGCTAITSLNELAFCYVNEDRKLKKDGHYVIRSCKSWPRGEFLHIQFLDETKVIIMMLINIAQTRQNNEMFAVYNCYLLVHGQMTIIFVVSVCLSVCAEFFSAVFDPILIKLGLMLYVWV